MRPLVVSHRPEALAYPERSIDSPERVRGALAVAASLGLAAVELPAAAPELAAVHAPDYLAALEALADQGARLDPELDFDRPLWTAAQASSADLAAAVGQALDGDQDVLALSRPGSHHAGRAFALGHCVVNHLAVAAQAALAGGLERVAVLDIDVHHGNGTQEIFWDDPRVLTVSLHQYPFFPGSGAAQERGGPRAPGSALNLPLPAGAAGPLYLERLATALEALTLFQPQLLLVEAGVDAHAEDWTADLALWDEDFQAIGQRLRCWAEQQACPLVLEFGGGYSPGAVQGGLGGLLSGLLELPLPARERGPAQVDLGQPRRGDVATLAAGLSGLRQHGLTLADSYPWTALFGAHLKQARPDWAIAFLSACPELARLPLKQAADFALVAWAEGQVGSFELDRELARWLRFAPVYARQELANTLAWHAGEFQADNLP